HMLALVFEWNDAGSMMSPLLPKLRNGVAGQNKAAIIANLVANGAKNYNVIFTFPEWRRHWNME
ncbi:8051_t:CDS:1, partial [Ambispora leptoticha]